MNNFAAEFNAYGFATTYLDDDVATVSKDNISITATTLYFHTPTQRVLKIALTRDGCETFREVVVIDSEQPWILAHYVKTFQTKHYITVEPFQP